MALKINLIAYFVSLAIIVLGDLNFDFIEFILLNTYKVMLIFFSIFTTYIIILVESDVSNGEIKKMNNSKKIMAQNWDKPNMPNDRNVELNEDTKRFLNKRG